MNKHDNSSANLDIKKGLVPMMNVIKISDSDRKVETLYKESIAPDKNNEQFKKTLTQQRANYLYKSKNKDIDILQGSVQNHVIGDNYPVQYKVPLYQPQIYTIKK